MAPRIKRTFERYGEGALTTGSPLRTERVPIARLHPAPWNPRILRDARFKSLCASLQADPEFLDLRPILATADGTVYGGNQRLRAAMHLGWAEVPAIIADIPEQLARERALKDNNNWGEWQADDLAALVYDLGQQGADLAQLGFDDKNLTRLLDSVGALGEGDDVVPDPPAEPITRAGDLWLLGPHRLLCGDATRPEDVARLLAGVRPGMLFTDPPYGLGLDIENDDLSGGSQDAFNAEWSRVAFEQMADDSAAVVFASTRTLPSTLDAIRAAGFEFLRLLTVYKPNDMTFPWHGWLLTSEAILLSQRGKARFIEVHPYAHDCYSQNHTAETLADDIGPHPAAKQMPVIRDLLSRMAGDSIYDPFLGSGTTLVAAHTLGRACYGMEIEPRYVDVAVARWEHLTGDTARREASA